MQTVDVRPFEPSDRPVIRELCHRVGYMGDPATFYWRHQESFAEIWTGYYTDQEPESLIVAVREGRPLRLSCRCGFWLAV